ncbi:hypothetical protein [Sphingobacterium psychroaquaticum]|uniref:Uncharacterized protein n=1 Tax=Sphingobacterium psychroaquaticum TaxID=561061 RepID=A0A1X7J7H0_9SPHI|nr:hypothetical protein [Sphingobacterium psychroaquaticum]QBQ40049.1 hypothetical protein E2P86_02335 [Sphingobacterium psychroaquaticum]SMG22934.1 hypothetical protein SAMN05660862_1476 [Sphingobacterium psychroaquaticum]
MHILFKGTFSKIASQLLLGLSLLSVQQAYAQKSTSHSPYSQFGLGQMREDLLPQTRAMGGVSTGVRYLNGLPTLNLSNPASYSAMNRTIMEAGLYGNLTQLSKNESSDNTADFAFSHIAIGIPLNKFGGLAFGLLPFSDVGYSATSTQSIDTLNYRTLIEGQGGVNKAFLGYGVSPIKGLSIGANVGFLFGNLYDITKVEFPNALGAYQTQQKTTRNIRGASFDYGVQYSKSLGRKYNLTVGYSGSLDNQITAKTNRMVTISEPSFEEDYEAPPLDTTSIYQVGNRKLNLPLKHNFGVTLSKGYNWMVGADFKYADWSKYQVRDGENKLGKSYGFAVGGQIKPDPTSVRYLNQVDYRLGFRYNQTPVVFRNQQINDMAVTIGLGLPLPESNFGRTFSQVNISAEFGQQGTLKNNLVRERYININLGFTINDSWFIRRSLD